MKVIKLDAIPSTNDFLKELSRTEFVENFTVVTAKKQFQGKGQMGRSWVSVEGKNLTMSVLIKNNFQDITEIFDLNVAVAISVIEVLNDLNLPKINIKWPNDIMSENKKIGGILIENTFKTDNSVISVVGIGLNVNQQDFTNLPKASSLYQITNSEFDLDVLLEKIVNQLKFNSDVLQKNESEILWKKYHENLFKLNSPMPFEDSEGKQFMGMIQKVNKNGQVEILLEDDSVQSFRIKEITMLF